MSRGYYVPCAPFLYFVPDSGGPPTPQGQTEGAGAAMEAVQRHAPPPTATSSATAAAPFQYLIHEQAKSLVALQELQNEVGALLEFRELVMDTFPHLRSKVCSDSDATPTTPCSAMVVPPPRWGPGVRVRRKLHPKERGGCLADVEDSSAESSSKPSKSQPKSSEGATSGSTVQDSGFSTETKEHHSSTSVLSPKMAASSSCTAADSMDELWNLLDVIQRKGSRLRDEVEELHTKIQHDAELASGGRGEARGVRGDGGEGCADVEEWPADVRSWGEEDDTTGTDDTPRPLDHGIEVQRLRHERDVLLDKVTEMEAETLQSRARVSQLQAELRQVASIRRDLEEQLNAAVTQKCELNTRIHDLHNQFVRRPTSSIPTPSCGVSSEPASPIKKLSILRISRDERARGTSSPPSPCALSSQIGLGRSSCFQPVARSCSSPSPRRDSSSRIPRLLTEPRSHIRLAPNQGLGRLDGVLSEPALVKRSLGTLRPDPLKMAAILKEHSPLELQRHLITTVVENQALQLRLQHASLNKGEITSELERVREENDDLKFQLEEKSIELEGTRARVRVLEKQHFKVGQQLAPEDPTLISSSTESAHDLTSPLPTSLLTEKPPEPPKRHNNKTTSTTIKGKKPSRIPLPPAKAFSAPTTKPTVQLNKNSLGRSSVKKINNINDSSLSLQNNLKSTNRDSISSKSSLQKSSLSAANNKCSLPRKSASRGNTSSSTKPNSNNLSKTASVDLDSTKDSLKSASLPMVEVALEPADSLNLPPPQQHGSSVMAWQSSPSEYFDSINSDVWARPAACSSSSSFTYKPQDSLETWEQSTNKWSSSNNTTNKNSVWRVSEHIETMLRQISKPKRCDD